MGMLVSLVIASILAFIIYLAFRAPRNPRGPAEPLWMQPFQDKHSLAEVTTRAFLTEFGACEDGNGKPLSVSRDLRIPPGTYTRFLDDLRIDHGLSVSGADADDVDTLPDLIEFLIKRHFSGERLY